MVGREIGVNNSLEDGLGSSVYWTSRKVANAITNNLLAVARLIQPKIHPMTNNTIT